MEIIAEALPDDGAARRGGADTHRPNREPSGSDMSVGHKPDTPPSLAPTTSLALVLSEGSMAARGGHVRHSRRDGADADSHHLSQSPRSTPRTGAVSGLGPLGTATGRIRAHADDLGLARHRIVMLDPVPQSPNRCALSPCRESDPDRHSVGASGGVGLTRPTCDGPEH